MEGSQDCWEECAVCSCQLSPPYIRCRQCVQHMINICLPCFARGAEVGAHQNDHAYSVVRTDFPLFDAQWTAAQELTLLTSLQAMGHGNWSDISVQQSDKSAAECERHYNKCYITNPHPSLPKFPEYEPDTVPAPVLFKLSDNPPRPPEGSALCAEMGGYSAPRGEFAVDFDNFAELDICTVTFDDDVKHGEEDEEEDEEEDVELGKELKMALLHSYHQKLRERHRRKRIVKDYGLINIHRMMMWQQHSHGEQREVVKSLQVFTSLMTPLRRDLLHQALAYEQELKHQICQLQEFRERGLTRHHSVPMYRLLRSRRATSRHRRHLLADVINHIRDEAVCQQWLQRQGVSDSTSKIIPLPSAPRRQSQPLNVEGMPGCDRLLPAEKELCEVQRLAPEAFLQYSAILVYEARKHGGLRLAQARTLIKIDVNKTRKIFDYLVQEGKIAKL